MYTNCHTYYSLRYGTFSELALLELAEQNRIELLALTDINSTTAVLNFLKESKDFRIWPVVGVDFRNGVKQQYVILAKNNQGYQYINEFLTRSLHEEKEFPDQPPELEHTFVIYPFEKVLELEKTDFASNEFIGISIRNLHRLPFTIYKTFTDKLVVQQTVTFRNKGDFNAHRLLRCIGLNTLLSKLPSTEQGEYEDQMVHKEVLLEKFAEYPFILENTKRILQQCKVEFFFDDFRINQNQQTYTESKESDYELLEKLVHENLAERYPVLTEKIQERIVKELEAIKKMNFVSYFLINWDIVGYARKMKYPYVGRGSGANSIVAYIIRITNVDPIDLDLYFERFINVFRSSPPDFDIDFSSTERNDVTRYIFERFEHTALMGSYVTFQRRAVIRELGKVFGLPKNEIDAFQDGIAIESKNDQYFKYIKRYSALIAGFPNYVSVHAGGILITEKPIAYYTATFMPPKGFQTVMFDMNIAEDIGIHKFDILGQRGLTKIKACLELISRNQPGATVENIDHVYKFKEDPNLNEMLKTGNCMGVFYVESPAMRVLMTKLRTNSYLDLVAASSIIRPGVKQNKEYIERHRFPEKRKEAHPVLLQVLHETHGVMVYQEDVLKVAHEFAGLTLAEADILRRGMRGKTRSKGEFETIEKKFKTKCLQKGYSLQVTNEVWELIQAFAGYAFAKGHSASYAVESYQSLYLKRYFPLEFLTAVLNSGGGFYNIETYLQEAIKLGAIIENPCINESDHPNTIKGKIIYLGFGMLRNLEALVVQRILNTRQLEGKFKDFNDFCDRVHIGIEQLIILIRANAFRFTGQDKHHLMWKAHLRFNKVKATNSTLKLFTQKPVQFTLPKIQTNFLIEAYDQLELLGFPLESRFRLLQNAPAEMINAKEIPAYKGRKITVYGKLVTAKGTPTQDKRLMYFGTFMDRERDIFDTVHFPNVSENFKIRAKGVYQITGMVMEELGSYTIAVHHIKFMPIQPDPRHHLPENSNKNINLTSKE